MSINIKYLVQVLCLLNMVVEEELQDEEEYEDILDDIRHESRFLISKKS